jgi:Na+/proline symporter
MWVRVQHFLELIRFSHTIFALPFAMLSAVIAWAQADSIFRWRDLALIYLRSLLVTAAAVAPALASYALWQPAAEAGALQMLTTSGLGVLCWLVTLRLAGHPLFGEIIGLLSEIVMSLRQRRAQPAVT